MDDSIPEFKASLRRDAIAARRALENKATRNNAIAQRLFDLAVFRDTTAVLSYVSKEDEVDTREIMGRELTTGREMYVPRTVDSRVLEWVRITSLDVLTEGRFGVMEPPREAAASPLPAKAVALIPGVAFDRTGNRLGWGQGYFDRFLADFQGDSIGLAFDCQLFEELPHEPHDRSVSFIVTETETIATAARRSP